MARPSRPEIERLQVSAYRIPTDAPESDGTLEWSHTGLVVVEAISEGVVGLGWSYANAATAQIVRGVLASEVVGRPATDVTGNWLAMVRRIRNQGRPGICGMAISAVDAALWDLKARLLELPLVSLLGAVRDGVALYGSGGFTSYDNERLCAQLGGWAAEGFTRVKLKVGRNPSEDPTRVRAVRETVGPHVEIFVDANGAHGRKEAQWAAARFAEVGVTWFEEPVSSDDLPGLHLLRDNAPPGMAITAGEYGYDLPYFQRMLDAEAVDVLQADGTRCGGITGLMRVDALCEARCLGLSAHCAPALHLHPACALPQMRHIEYFHDHVRIERMLFEGVATPERGHLKPDLSKPGMGLTFRREAAAPFAQAF